MNAPRHRSRPHIAFFDYPDVFEDFYPHYGIDQRTFATRWSDAATHNFVSLIQREVGDVTWYSFSVAPEMGEVSHEVLGYRVKFVRSSWAHRMLWRAFYRWPSSWRWRRAYRFFAPLASYLSVISIQFLRMLYRERPDAIYVSDYSTGRFDVLVGLGRQWGIPIIARHTGGRPKNYTGKLVKRWTIPRVTRLVVSSRSELEMLASRYGVPSENLSLILTPIDTEVFAPKERDVGCKVNGLDPSRRFLLFVGRLDDKVKRIGDLIRVVAEIADEHKDVDLVIVGEGQDGASLKRRAAELAPGRIHFMGWISDKERLAQVFSAAEWLILPSVKEGFPAVVGQAMACGTPVVASRVGGVPELVIDGRTGWLVEPEHPESLRARLQHVLRHAEESSAMGRQARDVAEERVGISSVATALKECFEEAMSESS